MKAKFVITVYTDLPVENYPFTEDVEESIIAFEVRSAEKDIWEWTQEIQSSDRVHVRGERVE